MTLDKFVVELVGTALLMFVILVTRNWLMIGLALAVAIYLGGAISCGAFNPAVVFGLHVVGKLPKTDIIPYIVAEIMGAIIACKLVEYL